jgi:predicted nucleic acid-binding protein
LQPEKTPYSVSLLLAETGNVLWKYQRKGNITGDQATTLYAKVQEICKQNVITIEPNELYGPKALHFAIEFEHSFYDLLFVSQALVKDVPLITSDERQAKTAEKCDVRVVRV